MKTKFHLNFFWKYFFICFILHISLSNQKENSSNKNKDKNNIVNNNNYYKRKIDDSEYHPIKILIDESLIDEVLKANTMVDSLDKIISEDDKNLELYDKLGYCDSEVENYELAYELEKLSPIEKKIIRSRYFEDMSQKEVGDTLGMYQVEVSRREKKILQKLKDNIAA